jgi:cellulose synthase/poly-beta-1,6-N-acetylglucosamine synthase-like glycosyltransferase
MVVCLLVVARQQNNAPLFYGGLVTVILQTVFLITLGAGGLTHPFFEFMDMRPRQEGTPSAAGKAALQELVLKGEAPKVDLFITCCKEPLDIIQDTVLAAITQDYPSVSYTVYVLDDGGDDNLKQWVEDTSRTWPGKPPKLVYIRRAKEPGKCSNYKAGNLNHALRLTSAPYVAQLDADMIPTPNFLTTLMAAMVEQPKAGFAFCTQVTRGGGGAKSFRAFMHTRHAGSGGDLKGFQGSSCNHVDMCERFLLTAGLQRQLAAVEV